MGNGDAIIFGSAIHGVPKDSNCKAGRISIAVFMIPTPKQIIGNPKCFYESEFERCAKLFLVDI